MVLSEADTRAKLSDPAFYSRGWSEDPICRETTLGAVEIVAGKARRRARGRTDYTLRVQVSKETQPRVVVFFKHRPGESVCRVVRIPASVAKGVHDGLETVNRR